MKLNALHLKPIMAQLLLKDHQCFPESNGDEPCILQENQNHYPHLHHNKFGQSDTQFLQIGQDFNYINKKW